MSRPFTEVLADLGQQDANEELTGELAQLVQDVQLHSKAGEITLKVKVSPNGMKSVKVDYKITTKLPDPDRPQTMFFVDDHNGLRRNDPRQSEMPLRDVKSEETPLKEVENA